MTIDQTGAEVLDDWDDHWADYSDANERNPAQHYRRESMLYLIGRDNAPRRLLDIGSGNGDLLAAAERRWPLPVSLAWNSVRREPLSHGVRSRVPTSRFAIWCVTRIPRRRRALGNSRRVLGGARARRRSGFVPAHARRMARTWVPSRPHGSRRSDVGIRSSHRPPSALLTGRPRGHDDRRGFERTAGGRCWFSVLQRLPRARYRRRSSPGR